MAKHKNKKNSLFHSGRDEGNEKNGARLTGDSIDLTANPGEESDSDLDINELLRKYMPEYRDEREADARIDELFSAAEDKTEPEPEESGADELTLPPDPEVLRTAEETPAELPLDLSEDFSADLSSVFSEDLTGETPDELIPDGALSSDDVSRAQAEGSDDAFDGADLFSGSEDGAADKESKESFEDFMSRIGPEEPESEPAAEEAPAAPVPERGGLFSRILKTTEEEAAAAPEAEPAAEAPVSGEESGIFSRIRRTVEDEENRRAEQIMSDEELLSALDSAFAPPAEDGSVDGDFQVPVSEVPGRFAKDDVIREYEFDLSQDGQTADNGQAPEDPAPVFTASNTVDSLNDSARDLDFADDRAADEVLGQTGKPVGQEMTDEQVMALFGEVKPQKKKFSLFHRKKKPKAALAEDEFLPDDAGYGNGIPAAPQNGMPVYPQNDMAGYPQDGAQIPAEGFADMPADNAEPVPADWNPDVPADWNPEVSASFDGNAFGGELPQTDGSGVPAFDANAAEDDTDALIAEATAAVFGRNSRADQTVPDAPYNAVSDVSGAVPEAENGGQLWEDLQYAEEMAKETGSSGDAFDGFGEFPESGSIDDEVEALWRQATAGNESVDASSADPVFADDGFGAASDNPVPAEQTAPAPGTSGGWARFAEKAARTADAAEPEIPASDGNADQMWEDAAAALQNAAQEHSVAVSAEMGTEAPAPEPTPAREPGKVPFVRQSRRSASNLSDEELLQWAAETLAENSVSHDFDPTPAPAEKAEEPGITADTAPAEAPIADVGEEIPDVEAFREDNAAELPHVTADSSIHDLENYVSSMGNSGTQEQSDPGQDTHTWQAPDKPYTEEEFDPTDINLMVAFDLDDGKGGQSGKAKALGDKLAKRQQNRDTTVRLDRPEFVDRTQIPAIRKEYRNRSLSLFIRLVLCVVFGVLLFLYENIEPVTKLLTGTGMQFGGVLDPRVYPAVYAMVSLQLMLFCCLCAYEEIIAGVKAVFTGIPKPESMTGLLALAGILYSAVVARVTEPPEEPVMFNFLVGLACFMTLMSAVYQNKREMMNFRIVSSKKTKHIVRRLRDDESELEARAFAEAEDACDVMKIEKTDFIDGFFARLQKPDQTTGTFMMFVMGAAVLLAVVVGIIDRVRGGTSADVARVIYESLLMITPMSVFIAFSYPFFRANLTARDYDSAIIGETSLEEYSNASIISFDDKNVFPSLSVKVQNVRIYNNARIDRVLYYASSVFACAGGPLQDVFEDVTKDLGISSSVKIFETEDDFLATQVDGVNIIFGGCEKLRARGFVIGDEAAEDDVDLSDELSIMYMFRENKLVAKMYIKYEMDPDIDSILKQFSGNGLYACVRTFDPNINEEMVSKKLSMKKMPLKIVRYANLDEVATYEAKVDSGLVTCGQQKSLLQVIAYCGKVLRTKKTHIALSVLAILVSTAIVTILELADLLPGMNSLILTLYQLAWLIPTVITSRVFIR